MASTAAAEATDEEVWAALKALKEDSTPLRRVWFNVTQESADVLETANYLPRAIAASEAELHLAPGRLRQVITSVGLKENKESPQKELQVAFDSLWPQSQGQTQSD